ncbi:MAG TPA: carbohydrate ABC transporter permease [Streptosporangiaceae bacterium]|nr:carbohydrate ABC transporter permease [Streptosporangiaceae bacterium]
MALVTRADTGVEPLAVRNDPKRNRRERPAALPTAILLLGAVYCLLPVAWVLVAATKNNNQLFNTFTFAPDGSLWSNVRSLSSYAGGVFWHWMGNTALYAGGGALASVAVSALTGYALAKYRFRGRSALFNILLAGVLVPPVVLAVPQYLLLARAGLTNTYWSVLLPSVISPYGIYLARIYAMAAVPDEVVESARVDGCPEGRLFARIAVPMMVPGLVTIFLFQFVAVWNNFLLPYIMLSDENKFPLTVGLYTLLNRGSSAPSLYSLVVTGSLLSIIPLIIVFLSLQRYWRTDIASGAVKQ